MENHFASIWEAVADVAADRDAVVQGTLRRSWTEYERRAAQFATVLNEAGLGRDSKVALYLHNSVEYLEAHFGALKLRAVPVNINYRYLDDELWYVLDNSDAEALVFHRSLADRVERVRERLPKLKLVMEVNDGSSSVVNEGSPGLPYEDVLATADPLPRIHRSEDDHYMLYTGGTTGRPKGVVHRMGPFAAMFLERGSAQFNDGTESTVAGVDHLVRDLIARDRVPVTLVCPPLIHGTGLWIGSMMPHCVGGTAVLLTHQSYDGREVLETIERERATFIVLVGDVMSQPVFHALQEDRARGRSYDLSSVETIFSAGVMWTSKVKQQLLDEFPDVTLMDRAGSTEAGIGVSYTRFGDQIVAGRFQPPPSTKVFGEDGREIEPGSGEVGMIASCSATLPLGYYKDPDKTAETFRVIRGERYGFSGDWATLDEDGSLILLGRDTQCINTGGEKVFPEEVEETLKSIEGIADCLVMGVADDRYGQRVEALVSLDRGTTLGEPEIVAATKETLANYKAPKRVWFTDKVPRFENGKPDYTRATQIMSAERN